MKINVMTFFSLKLFPLIALGPQKSRKLTASKIKNESFGPKILIPRWRMNTARPRDTRILVPEKNRAAQNRASWGLYLCTKWDFFSKNSASSRLFFKIRASWGYTYVLKGILFSSPSIFWGVLNQNRPF